jgi:hypothetical protein
VYFRIPFEGVLRIGRGLEAGGIPPTPWGLKAGGKEETRLTLVVSLPGRSLVMLIWQLGLPLVMRKLIKEQLFPQ